MNDDTLTIRQGATFYEVVEDDDITAETVTITVSDDVGVVLSVTSPFSVIDGKAVAELISDDTDLPVGTYKYMLTVVYPDAVVKLPNLDGCDYDCDLPDFIVCEANDMEEIS